jgi:hypothetical protein
MVRGIFVSDREGRNDSPAAKGMRGVGFECDCALEPGMAVARFRIEIAQREGGLGEHDRVVRVEQDRLVGGAHSLRNHRGLVLHEALDAPPLDPAREICVAKGQFWVDLDRVPPHADRLVEVLTRKELVRVNGAR